MPEARASPAVSPHAMIEVVLAASRDGAEALRLAVEGLPAPAYLTDPDGIVTAHSSACIEFAGRTPVNGADRWCVTWRLYEESGAALPHDQCPMAVAIKERRDVRGAIAVAERPDGSRVLFMPYATPICGPEGGLTGAFNILIDITDARQADALEAQALRCRRLAQSITDTRTIETLQMIAAEYEEKARALRG